MRNGGPARLSGLLACLWHWSHDRRHGPRGHCGLPERVLGFRIQGFRGLGLRVEGSKPYRS